MVGLDTQPVVLSIEIGLDSEELERHLVASPRVVGAELALQVDEYVTEHRLGYYPALAFFKEQGGVEPELLKAADDIAWFLTNWVQEEVERLLRPLFAQLRFDAVQATAFSMPTARPRGRVGVEALARHFTVDQVRLLVEATAAGKRAVGDPQAIAEASADEARRSLERYFPALRLVSVAVD